MPGQPDPAQGQLDLGDAEAERSLLANLLASSRLYHTSKDYLALLDFVSRLRNFAPFNAMLLQVQRPGLTYAASAWDWQTRFNRIIKEGARPLVILWPFSPVALIYDVLDTEGDELPADVAQTFHAIGPVTELAMERHFTLLHAQKELEAESLAYLVCKRHGVASKSESYLANYVVANTTVGALDLDTLLKAAGQVETVLGIAAETLFQPRPGTKRQPKGQPKLAQPDMPDLFATASPDTAGQGGSALPLTEGEALRQG